MSVKYVDSKQTSRAEAFELWMGAPNPMVTFVKTLDVTPLVRLSRRRGKMFNMLMCWCIGNAASQVKEFYTLPVNGKLCRYDGWAVNCIVDNKNGEVSSCDVPYSDDLRQFERDYLRLTAETAESCQNHDLPDKMVIGTSAIVDTELDAAVGMYSGIFNNPFSSGADTAADFLKNRSRSRSSSIIHKWTAHTQADFFLFFKTA